MYLPRILCTLGWIPIYVYNNRLQNGTSRFWSIFHTQLRAIQPAIWNCVVVVCCAITDTRITFTCNVPNMGSISLTTLHFILLKGFGKLFGGNPGDRLNQIMDTSQWFCSLCHVQKYHLLILNATESKIICPRNLNSEGKSLKTGPRKCVSFGQINEVCWRLILGSIPDVTNVSLNYDNPNH